MKNFKENIINICFCREIILATRDAIKSDSGVIMIGYIWYNGKLIRFELYLEKMGWQKIKTDSKHVTLDISDQYFLCQMYCIIPMILRTAMNELSPSFINLFIVLKIFQCFMNV